MPCRCDYMEDKPPTFVDPLEKQKQLTCRAQHLIYKLRKLIPGEIPEALRPRVEDEINALYSHKVDEAQKDFLNENQVIKEKIDSLKNRINSITKLGGIVPVHLRMELQIEEKKLEERKFIQPSVKELLG